jgi:long-subunit fatty acid transport protein
MRTERTPPVEGSHTLNGHLSVHALLGVFVILFSASASGQSKVGYAAASFLNLAVGPRAVAMGGAFVATADDASALYWNPAGISGLKGNSVMFAHTSWFAGINYNWTGACVDLGSAGAVGVSINYLNYGEIEVTTNKSQEGTGEMFSPSDMNISLTYAYSITDRFSIGGTVKYIRETIWNSSASAVAVDVGTLFLSDLAGLRIGATITNFGTDMQMSGKDLDVLHDLNVNTNGNNDQILAALNTDQFPLPLTFKVGVAMDLLNTGMNRLSIGADAVHPNNNAESVNIGGEYVFERTFSLRAGYKSVFLERTVEGLSLGAGVKYELSSGLALQIDYAYQKLRNTALDDTQHLSIGIRF